MQERMVMVQLSEVPNEEVTHKTRQYVESISSLNADPYFRDAIMRFAIREITWSFLEKFGDKYSLAEQLRTMAGVIEEHQDEDNDKVGAAPRQ